MSSQVRPKVDIRMWIVTGIAICSPVLTVVSIRGQETQQLRDTVKRVEQFEAKIDANEREQVQINKEQTQVNTEILKAIADIRVLLAEVRTEIKLSRRRTLNE